MATPEIQITTVADPATAVRTMSTHGHAFGFHEFLSAINPLQYLPVVGTIYRAVTGDVIPEVLREGGSLLISGLLGGPIGLIANIVTTLAEKITGIDPEKIAAAELGPTPAKSPVADPPPAPIAKVASAPVQPPASLTQTAFTADQVSAYSGRPNTAGTLKPNDRENADALNGMELVRLSEVAAAYTATQARSFGLKPG